MSEQIRRCVGSIIFVPDRRRFGDLYVRIRTIIRLFLILAQKKKVSEKDTFFFVMLPVHYPFLFLNHLWSSQLSLFEKPSYRNK